MTMSTEIANDTRSTVLFVCTGNAARSVMAAALLRLHVPSVRVISAGTHSIPGLAMSVRTKRALDSVGAADPDHRSTQLDGEIAAQADLIIVFEPMHITWIRRELPHAAARAASLPRLARDLAVGSATEIGARVETLELDRVTFEPWEEVVDPAGGELPEFEAAAAKIAELITELGPKLDQIR